MNSITLYSQAAVGGSLRTVRQALTLASLCLCTGLATSGAQKPGYTILYSFQCGADGGDPKAGVVQDSAGNLYGTTIGGGAFGLGTVFEIPSGGQETVLYSFGSSPTDGQSPTAGLVRDAAGNLYGTTQQGGASGYGTVFRVSPDGTETVLHSFAGFPTDGESPQAGLILDTAGNLYGTTYYGGSEFGGVVFKLTPAGAETLLHSFPDAGTTDGGGPLAGLVNDSAGNLYGTTQYGGTFRAGTVFKVARGGKETLLYSFAGAPDGSEPVAALLRDAAGNLYGTTPSGGSLGGGTVFKLDPTGAETVLFSFDRVTATGYGSGARLIKDPQGNLAGTTSAGGGEGFTGVVFLLNPAGKEGVLHRFAGYPTDGSAPLAGLIQDSAGNLYGTTSEGGPANCGTVFKIAP